LSAKALEGGGGRGHPDFHDGREHHLDDDRHFPERQRKQLFGASSRICPWGNGDGSTTFNVPDRRYRTPNTVAKIKTNEDSSSAYLILATPMAEPTGLNVGDPLRLDCGARGTSGVSYFAQNPDGQRRRRITIDTSSQGVRSSIQAESEPIRVSVASPHFVLIGNSALFDRKRSKTAAVSLTAVERTLGSSK
jgi:hypothetical protein